MFTVLKIAATAAIGWYADRANANDRLTISSSVSDDEVRQCILHARQDLKFIAFLLAGILIMLGIIADRTG